MACKYCEYKGYIVSSYMANNIENRSIKVCPKCNDVKAYSAYVKSLYGAPTLKKVEESEDNVIDISEFLKKK